MIEVFRTPACGWMVMLAYSFMHDPWGKCEPLNPVIEVAP